MSNFFVWFKWPLAAYISCCRRILLFLVFVCDEFYSNENMSHLRSKIEEYSEIACI